MFFNKQEIQFLSMHLNLSSMAQGSVINTLVQNLTFLISFHQFYFFRAYIASGPPISKTVVHGMVTSLTYLVQLNIWHLYSLLVIGFFPDMVVHLINTYPEAVCQFATPWMYGPTLILYLMYLAFFKLLIVAKTDLFLSLNHDALVRRINVFSIVFILGFSLGKFLAGNLCIPQAANILIWQRMSIQANIGNVTAIGHSKLQASKEDVGNPFFLVTIAIALVCYVSSFLIKTRQKLRAKRTENRYNNNLGIASGSARANSIIPRPEVESNHNSFCCSPIQARLAADSGNPTSSRVTQLVQVRPTLHPNNMGPQPVNMDLQSTYLNPQPNTRDPRSSVREPEPPLMDLRTAHMDPLTVMMNAQQAGVETQVAVMDPVQTAPQEMPIVKRNPKLTTGIEQVPSSTPPVHLNAPQSVTNSVQQGTSTKYWFGLEKLFDKMSISFGLVLFVMCILFAILDGQEPFTKMILRLGHKYILECLPMYWILMVEECFQLAVRRTKAWINNVLRLDLN